MQLNQITGEALAEKLHDFNPNLNVQFKAKENKVVATIDKLELNANELHTLAKVLGVQSVTFGRTGDKLRLVIS
jgi:hypothetical protein